MNTLTQEQVDQIFEGATYREHADGKVMCAQVDGEAALNAAFALGVAQERESAAKVCDEIQKKSYLTLAKQCAEAIRARK
jgi:hypothetical protein